MIAHKQCDATVSQSNRD